MKLRAMLGALALVTSAFVLQPAPAKAADLAPVQKTVHKHAKKPYHKHVHVVAHHGDAHVHAHYVHDRIVHRISDRVAGLGDCLFGWLRHRHHAEAAYTPAPHKVVYAKKVAYKKVAYATPLK